MNKRPYTSEDENGNFVKPPLGLTPAFIFYSKELNTQIEPAVIKTEGYNKFICALSKDRLEYRLSEINAAIKRYANFPYAMEISKEWIEERLDICVYLKELSDKGMKTEEEIEKEILRIQKAIKSTREKKEDGILSEEDCYKKLIDLSATIDALNWVLGK